MTAFICNGLGTSFASPSRADIDACLDELDPDDEEHGAAWVSAHGLNLEWELAGRFVLHAVGEYVVRHMKNVTRARAIEIWLDLLEGRVESVRGLAWEPGNGHVPPSDEELARIKAASLAVDREWYDSLGAERPEEPCRWTGGCTRGSIPHSVLCRPHHFESLTKRRSPFDH